MNMQNNKNAMYTVYFALYGIRDLYGAEIICAMINSKNDIRIRKIRVAFGMLNTKCGEPFCCAKCLETKEKERNRVVRSVQPTTLPSMQ